MRYLYFARNKIVTIKGGNTNEKVFNMDVSNVNGYVLDI